MMIIDLAHGYDYASNWGLTDFYPDCLETLKKALESGNDFQTEWFWCKKELRYGRYTKANGQFKIEVRVNMDDLWEEADLIYDAIDISNIPEEDLPDDFVDDIREAASWADIDDHTELKDYLPYEASLEEILTLTEELEGRCEMANEEMFSKLCDIVKDYCEQAKTKEEEPDVIQTAQGFAPNYEKFEALGMTTEEALVWCNMD